MFYRNHQHLPQGSHTTTTPARYTKLTLWNQLALFLPALTFRVSQSRQEQARATVAISAVYRKAEQRFAPYRPDANATARKPGR